MVKNKNMMFAHIPSDKPSLRVAHELWLKRQSPIGNSEPKESDKKSDLPLNIGIIGGGMAGLYSALLLQSQGHTVHILESNSNRLGGRVFTHRFNDQPNQYFEAGAMRLPDIPEQKPVFNLISYLNNKVGDEYKVNLIPYILYDKKGNRVYVNGTTNSDGSIMTVEYANAHPKDLGFTLDSSDKHKTAQNLIDEAIQPFLDLLKKDFDKGFQQIIKYDNYSFGSYLSLIARWSADKINYAEVMTSQTNQFQNSFTELVIENMDFTQATWHTIENGMDRLPNACAQVIGHENITMGAEVYKLENTSDGKVAVHYISSSTPRIFDKVIAAVPPAVVKMWKTPQWSSPKTQSIRALHFEPLYKIGMRFSTRFWETVSNPSKGGQSISDLPSRWFVYPSYGIGDNGTGVLLLYSWMTDAYTWLPQLEEDKVRIALRDLESIYPDVDIQNQFIESFDVTWSEKWATGDAMFYPGQFKNLFNIAREPEGNIYFAGEHLSVHHTWIVGAVDSALLACQQLLHIPDLPPLQPESFKKPEGHNYDYPEIIINKKPLLHEVES